MRITIGNSMRYTVTQVANELEIEIKDVRNAIKFGMLNTIYDNKDNVLYILYDNFFIAYKEYIEYAKTELGTTSLPIYKMLAGKRVRIVNALSIHRRMIKNRQSYVVRYSDGRQAVFSTIEKAIEYAKHDTSMVKRSSGHNTPGNVVIPFTIHELYTLLQYLPRNTYTKRLITKIKKRTKDLENKLNND